MVGERRLKTHFCRGEKRSPPSAFRAQGRAWAPGGSGGGQTRQSAPTKIFGVGEGEASGKGAGRSLSRDGPTGSPAGMVLPSY